MVFIDSYKHEISPEFASELLPELKDDFLRAHPCKWDEVTIQLWRVATARIEDCNPLIEKHSFLCTPVLFDKEDEPGYFTLCDKTMQEQIAEFDQQLGVIHEWDCTLTDGYDDTDVKVKLLQIDSEINYGNKL
jgi:hypothetical protein